MNNIALTRTSGIDLLAGADWKMPAGELSATIAGNYLFDFKQRKLTSSPLRQLLNTQHNPIDFRARATLSWDFRNFGVTTALNYTDDYRDIVSTPNRHVASWATFDVMSRLGPKTDSPGTSVMLSMENVADRDPPFFNNPKGIAYDPEHADVLGRTVSARLRKVW
jgi:iron complex outermembrane receptor protein